jgi:tRNA(Ile)-lysidine synthase
VRTASAQKKDSAPVSAIELKSLFANLSSSPAIVLAVSGGPDSTALMALAARWRKTLKVKPKLTAVTIDHALRKESKAEALAVGRLARKLGLKHMTLRWSGKKPATGLQQAARRERYRLLVSAAKQAKAGHIATAHTLDDQAETVLIRMARGSGLTGLRAMARQSALDGLILVRPFLDLPKSRLVATLRAAKIAFADDPSNRDPKFTRARLRGLMPAFAQEGLTAQRLARLARRLRRADLAIEAAVDRAMADLASRDGESIVFQASKYAGLPDEIALRLIGRAVARLGQEGPAELGKLEAMMAALAAALSEKADNQRFGRTLAGASVSLVGGRIMVARAPARRQPAVPAREAALTTRGRGKAKAPKAR